MKIITKLTLKSLKLNKKRTIGTIIGIVLSIALICAIAGMGTSFRQTVIETVSYQEGYYHFRIGKTNDEILKIALSNRDFKDVNAIYDLGYAEFVNNNLDKEFIHIKSLTDTSLSKIGARLTKGELPKNEKEIILTESAMEARKLSIGDSITLRVGKRMTLDGFELDDSNPYNGEETLENAKTHKYQIVGVFTGASYSDQYLGFTTNEKSERINMYVTLLHPFEYKKTISKFLGVEDYHKLYLSDKERIENEYGEFTTNNELLRWEVFDLSDGSIKTLTTILAIVIFIVVITSVYCIRNSFAISTTEKIKMYGMLASVGATKKQIRKSVLTEAFVLCLIAIPLGVLSGIFADLCIVKVVNYLISDMLEFNGGLILSINFVPIIISIILGVVTVYLSALSSSIKASRVSPIENLRNNNEIKISRKKLKSPKMIKRIFGIGGVIADKNIRRSKKKYRTTVISLTISIFTFIAMSVFINEGMDITGDYYKNIDYNIAISSALTLTDKDIETIKDIEEYDSFTINYMLFNSFVVDNLKFSDKEIMESDEDIFINVVAIDHDSFLDYIKKLKLNPRDVKNKGILVDNYRYYKEKENKTYEKRMYSYRAGDILKGKINEKDVEIPISKVSDIRPRGYEDSYYFGGNLFVDKNDFSDLKYVVDSILIESDKHRELVSGIEELYPDLNVHDLTEEARYQRNITIVISIFLYGFIIVITLIGVTNIFNTITSNMELRQKEFAMLKSIGMTNREFKRMINLETLFYSVKSLFFGIILGILAGYLIHGSFTSDIVRPYKLPYTAILISIVFVILIVFMIMHYSMNKINKQNIIETIRKDNI